MGLHSWQKSFDGSDKTKNVVKKCQKIIFLNPFLGQSETGSKSMSRSIMASSSQKWS